MSTAPPRLPGNLFILQRINYITYRTTAQQQQQQQPNRHSFEHFGHFLFSYHFLPNVGTTTTLYIPKRHLFFNVK